MFNTPHRKFNEQGWTFIVYTYRGPSKNPRGFWHGDNPINKDFWAYCFLSEDGKYWKYSDAVGGFESSDAALAAVRDKIGPWKP